MAKKKTGFGLNVMGQGVRGGKSSATGIGSVGATPQGNVGQQTRYPKKGGKNSRPNSRK